MSGEIQIDVADAYRVARTEVERSVNDRMKNLSLDTTIEQWAFIAIIRPNDHADYPEIKRRDARRSVLEFRLKIDHGNFLRGTPEQHVKMIIAALKRAIEQMPELGISKNDCSTLASLLGH